MVNEAYAPDSPKSWTLRQKIWSLFDTCEEYASPHWQQASNMVTYVALSCILASCACVCVESLPRFTQQENTGTAILKVMEVIFAVVFTIEFVLRVASCPSQRKLWLGLPTLVDIVSIFPFYIELFLDTRHLKSFVVFRIFRVFRAVRVLKFSRYSESLQIVGTTVSRSKDALLLLLLLLGISLCLFGSAIYLAEQSQSEFDSSVKKWRYNNNKEISPFQSVFHSFWFTIIAMTTLGYGDVVPHTDAGRVVTSLAMLSGTLALALPTVLVGKVFTTTRDEYRARQKKKSRETVKSEDESTSPMSDEIPTVNWTRRAILWSILDENTNPCSPFYDKLSKAVSFALFALILVTSAIFFVETIPQLYALQESGSTSHVLKSLDTTDLTITVVFTVEFLLRVAVCPNRKLLFRSAFTWIDVLAIFPRYAELAARKDRILALQLFRALRFIRILKALKLSKYNVALRGLIDALRGSVDALFMMAFLLAMGMLLFGSALWLSEQAGGQFNVNEQRWYRADGKVSPFQSIPGSFWLVIVTMTTVGFGDVYPITLPGKLVAGACAVSGILFLSFPIIIVGAAFDDHHARQKRLEERRLELLNRASSAIMAASAPKTKAARLLNRVKLLRAPRPESLPDVSSSLEESSCPPTPSEYDYNSSFAIGDENATPEEGEHESGEPAVSIAARKKRRLTALEVVNKVRDFAAENAVDGSLSLDSLLAMLDGLHVRRSKPKLGQQNAQLSDALDKLLHPQNSIREQPPNRLQEVLARARSADMAALSGKENAERERNSLSTPMIRIEETPRSRLISALTTGRAPNDCKESEPVQVVVVNLGELTRAQSARVLGARPGSSPAIMTSREHSFNAAGTPAAQLDGVIEDNSEGSTVSSASETGHEAQIGSAERIEVEAMLDLIVGAKPVSRAGSRTHDMASSDNAAGSPVTVEPPRAAGDPAPAPPLPAAATSPLAAPDPRTAPQSSATAE
eukprot:TRINITY_DN7838_c0_g1_i2.p1 TRINITY_DN7838_c0_g1~~TRINITY_DN7838_c0_g1_i2.p1  ORF type:complete len:973 (+),score=146.67 TRINITY_DN7838_c0_g1_i2:89-3007(+)